MSPKFWFRTSRNLLFRTRPYFAHLALTHRCNLRCHFCHIPEKQIPEQDTAGMKRVIDCLPPDKRLTVNITVSSSNREQGGEIVAYCTREFPRARLWLNPVVVGQGKLRVPTEQKVNPDFLRRIDSPTLLAPGSYREGCEDYCRHETYNWGCLAGELFFDVKPNGDFWMCQDHPSPEPLNILDPEFERKRQKTDFSSRRECSGCTYSCYWLTQKSFLPAAWPGMAGVWWKSHTQPGEPCRQTAEQRGNLAGVLHFFASRFLTSARLMARVATSLTLLLGLVGVSPSLAQNEPVGAQQEDVIARMEQANAQRRAQLASFRGRRRYSAANSFLRRRAYLEVQADFATPDEIRFQVLDRGGSRTIERRVFKPMLETEQANIRLPARNDVEICRRNYTFTFEQYDDKVRAYVFSAVPSTSNKYLFRGRIWVDESDFAIRRIEGEPSKKPSFWVSRTRFVHVYEKFGDFWFPVQNRTEVELRLFGRASMGIDYYDYEWRPQTESRLSDSVPPLHPLLATASPAAQASK